MDIKNPEYILEIARQQSVTHAAEKLFVTQSTLSQYLLKLENELGTPLFSREKSGLVPTEAGHVYLHAARAVVQIQNAAEASIAALKKEGFLCVGVSFWGLTLLTGLLPAFKSRFPDITLRIFVDDYAHLKVMMQAGLRYQLLYPTIILSFVTIAFYLIGNAFSDAADPKNHMQ